MANLCAGICSSLMKVRKAQDTDGFTQRRTGLQASGRGGSLPVESVAAFPWNGWQACRGISGRFGVEYAYWPKGDLPMPLLRSKADPPTTPTPIVEPVDILTLTR